jgi:membrane fusion protein, copper/silver efflux system
LSIPSPLASSIRTRAVRVAFVAKGEGVFEPRDLVLGRRGNGLVEVREGVGEGERVVVAGNFLIDAESNLRAALARFTAPPSAP